MSETKTRSHKAQKVIERMGKKLNRQIVGSLVACVHCGMCTDSCHYVLANPGDPTYAPAYKGDKIRKLFKRHFDWTGRVIPWWVKAGKDLTDEELFTYSRQIVLADIGYAGQLALTNARVCLIGVGGLGSPIALKLVGMGMGSLRVGDWVVVPSMVV